MTDLDTITVKGVLTANRIRIILAVGVSAIIAGSFNNNPMLINITFYSAIFIFIILSVINYLLAKRKKIFAALFVFTTLFEITLISSLKLTHVFTGREYMVINETVVVIFYWFILLLAMLHNNRRLVLLAGTTIVLQYSALLSVSILVLDVPFVIGQAEPGYICLDNEIVRILVIMAFTAVALVVIRNLNSFATEALASACIADDKKENLEVVVSRAGSVANELERINREHAELELKFSHLAQNQAAVSEEMSASFEEISSVTDSINNSMKNQMVEGKKVGELVDLLTEIQSAVISMEKEMLHSVQSIVKSAESARGRLSNLRDTMSAISRGGEDINNFIAMINDINDKVNLLSLNASIEAARAGEHGKGFAVVADEISKLATATSDNSKEISVKIDAIINDIKSGIDFTEQTGQSTGEIFENVKVISDSLDAVQSSIERQALAIGELRDQSRALIETSESIANSTEEQLHAMEENVKTVQSVAGMTLEIADFTRRMEQISGIIREKSSELRGLVALER